MELNYVKDYSLFFDDSSIVIIPVDAGFNPIDKEGNQFVEIYKKCYKKCREDYFQGKVNSIVYAKVKPSKTILFVPVVNFRKNWLSSLVSFISRIAKYNGPVSILCEGLTETGINNVKVAIPNELRCFLTVFV